MSRIRDDYGDMVLRVSARPAGARRIRTHGQGQLSTLRHRVPGVGGQIEDRLFEGGRVHIRRRRRNVNLPAEQDPLPDKAPHQRFHSSQELDQIESLWPEGNASRERKQLAGEDGGVLGGAKDGAGVVPWIGALAAGNKRRKPGDGGQAVVEVMGDATSELAEGLEALGFDEPSGYGLALGDVDELDHDAGGRAVDIHLDGVVDL